MNLEKRVESLENQVLILQALLSKRLKSDEALSGWVPPSKAVHHPAIGVSVDTLKRRIKAAESDSSHPLKQERHYRLRAGKYQINLDLEPDLWGRV